MTNFLLHNFISRACFITGNVRKKAWYKSSWMTSKRAPGANVRQRILAKWWVRLLRNKTCCENRSNGWNLSKNDKTFSAMTLQLSIHVQERVTGVLSISNFNYSPPYECNQSYLWSNATKSLILLSLQTTNTKTPTYFYS